MQITGENPDSDMELSFRRGVSWQYQKTGKTLNQCFEFLLPVVFENMFPQKSRIIIADAPRSTDLQPTITEAYGKIMKVCLDEIAPCREDGGALQALTRGGGVDRLLSCGPQQCSKSLLSRAPQHMVVEKAAHAWTENKKPFNK